MLIYTDKDISFFNWIWIIISWLKFNFSIYMFKYKQILILFK